MPIDKELLKEIKSAKTPRHFIYILGAEANVLKLSRSAIPSSVVAKVKKEAGGDKGHKGKAVLEETDAGTTLVFFMPKVDKALEPKLRRTVKERAGLSLRVEIRKPTKPDEGEVEGDGGESGEAAAVSAAAQPAAELTFEQQYRELAAELAENAAALQSLNPKMAKRVRQTLDAVAGKLPKNAAAKQWKTAFLALKKLKATADKAKLTVDDGAEAVALKASYKTLREKLGLSAARLKALQPGSGENIAKFLAKADALAGDQLAEGDRDYQRAGKMLQRLEKFLDKALPKAIQRADKKQQGKLDQSTQDHGNFDKTRRAVKALVKRFAAEAPASPAAAQYEERLAHAAALGQRYEYGAALSELGLLEKQVQNAVAAHAKLRTKAETVEKVLAQAAALTQPKLPAALLRSLRDDFAAARRLADELDVDSAQQAFIKLDEAVRRAMSERRTFADAGKETAALLNQAEGVLAPAVFDPLEAEYLGALDDYDDARVTTAYDAVTRVQAQLQTALRGVDLAGVAAEGKVTKATAGKSREARRLRIRANMDGLRKALPLLAKHDPMMATRVEEWLAKQGEERNQKLGAKEKELEQLIAEANAAVAQARGRLQKDAGTAPPKQAPAPPPPNLKKWASNIESGQVLAKVKIGKKLGEGGYGGVFRLEPDDQNQGASLPTLVVKLPPLEDEDDEDPSIKERNQRALEDVEKEAKVYERLGDHPNIVKCLGMRDVGGKRGLVMEAVRGKTTNDFTKQLKTQLAQGKITQTEFWSTVQYTLGKTLSALAHIHDCGLTHNDVKPQNIMVDETTGDVKVIDVGTANAIDDVTQGVDNPLFKAPERLRGAGSTPETDGLAAGAAAFGSVSDDKRDVFHFGDREGMQTGFMSKVEKIILEYGELTGDVADNAAVRPETADQPNVRRYNERGEDDAKGKNVVRDLSRTANQSAFAEFMNGVLHPDASKRLSPKEALEHPFLRDMLLPEDQVKQLIQRSGQLDAKTEENKATRTTATDLQKLVVGPAATTDYNRLRGLADDARINELAVKDLLKTRAEFTEHLATAGAKLLTAQRGVAALAELVAAAPLKDTQDHRKDVKDLAALRDREAELIQLRDDFRIAQQALDRRILQAKAELTESLDAGEALNVADLERQLTALAARRTALENSIKPLSRPPVVGVLTHLSQIADAQQELDNTRAQTAKERRTLLQLLRTTTDAASFARGQKQTEALATHMQELTRIEQLLAAARTEAERVVKETTDLVDALGVDAAGLRTELDRERSAMEVVAKLFEAQARAPRDTAEAVAEFEKVRQDLAAVQKDYQEAAGRLRPRFTDCLKQAAAHRARLGTEVPDGVDNPLPRLDDVETQLHAGLKLLAEV